MALAAFANQELTLLLPVDKPLYSPTTVLYNGDVER